jgi:ABC-type transport system substrate-binding protein
MLGSNAQFGKPFDDIVAQIKIAATSSDTAVRQKAYDEVNKLYKQHVPSIPIAHSAQFEVFDAKVTGVKIGPYNENFEEMTGIGGKLIYSQGGEPNSLDCVDETDGDSFRVCDQVFNHLYDFEYGGAAVKPSLAEKCTANADLTQWTCALRKGVKFSNGAAFDATDVYASFVASWDAADPLHKGRVGDFQYFSDFFGGQINKPAK